MANNIVIRECDKCGYYADDSEFSYTRVGIWQCPNCFKKYTHIREVIDPDEEKGGRI